MPIRIVAALVAVTLALASGPPASAAVVFRPPTDAAVLDPFRPPAGPYGPGNRGIEYATPAGRPVRAAAAGTVTFSGPVGGDLFVTVDHGGGVRSTVGFVAHLLVRRGDAVGPGQVIARTGGPFHFTVRIDGRYVDPARLFGRHRTRVHLVPHHRPVDPRSGPATLPDGPIRALRRQIGGDAERSSVPIPVASAPGYGWRTGKRTPWQSSP